MRYIGEVHRGVRGFVLDPYGRPIEGASLKVSSRDVGFTSTKYGEYWRVLLPGNYKIEVIASNLTPVVWGIRIQPTFALVRVVKGD